MWDYTDKVRDHFLNPRNVGEIPDPDGIGEVGNITCGDALRLTFKLDEHQKIADIRFKTFGCGSAIASASALTELCKGKTLDEASKITNKDIAATLDGLPKEKMHCSVMGQEALEAAIAYYKTGGKKTVPKEKEGSIVCTCFNVTDREIERAIRENNLKTVDDVTNFTKAGGGCGGCREQIQQILDTINGPANMVTPASATPLTILQKIDKIREVIQKDIKPILVADGGDCELVDINGNEVIIRFIGQCKGCAFSNLTLISVVENKLKEKVSQQLVVKTI
jgi:Fe-S cluster assembly protein NifU